MPSTWRSKRPSATPMTHAISFLAGKALLELGRNDLSVRWLEQAIALNTDYPEPHYLLARAYRRLGRTADAERALKSFQAAAARAPKERR